MTADEVKAKAEQASYFSTKQSGMRRIQFCEDHYFMVLVEDTWDEFAVYYHEVSADDKFYAMQLL